MNIIISIIFILLFVILLAFILSMAFLTPIIGKKNIIMVLVLGFIIGCVGGAFFISPVYDDAPIAIRDTLKLTTEQPTIMTIGVSSDTNVNSFTYNFKKQDGVLDVRIDHIEFNVTSLSDTRAAFINSKLGIVNSNFTNWTVNKNGLITLSIKEGFNPRTAVDIVEKWLLYTADIAIHSDRVFVVAEVDPGQSDTLRTYIEGHGGAVVSVEGDLDEQSQSLIGFLPSNSVLIVLCGLVGLLVGLFGVFVDRISAVIYNINDIIRRNFKRKK